MQRILISLVIAVLAGLSANAAEAATSPTVVMVQTEIKPKMHSTVLRIVVPHVALTIANIQAATPVTPTLKPPVGTLTTTVTITRLKPITAQMIGTTPVAKKTPATAGNQATATAPPPTPPLPTPPPPVAPTPTPDADAAYTGAITGTIIANRTEANVRFFVEGATYNLAALRSLGLNLPRSTAVLNLYNCDASTPESKDCFWDPYLLDQNGFYEVVKGSDAGKTVGLSLRQAGTPPTDRVWVQNRTGKHETLFYNENVYDVPPSSVQEFKVEQNAPTILLHLRSCVTMDGKSACEWSPHNAQPGYYYALVETSAPGQTKNSTVNTLALQPVLAPAGQTPSKTAPAAPAAAASGASTTTVAPAQAVSGTIICRLQVPIINIRSGPGLQYQVIGRVAANGQEPGTVHVIGRDATQQWVAVDDKTVPGGWMTASPGFMECNGDLASLPIAQVTDGRLEPTPQAQVAAAPAGSSGDQTPAATAQANVTPTVALPTVPPGQALLVVNNGFGQQIRFTLDQVYRIQPGPSEFDLQPGQGINILVHPGQIAFSASSPWNSLAGNKEFFLDDQKTRVMWIVFVPNPDGSGGWLLQY